ncbi:unnamed protein product [Pedinophyceae sp. YPF-701]|nr:unnamed protein product [Pedinophyceae sp. YPF-701]
MKDKTSYTLARQLRSDLARVQELDPRCDWVLPYLEDSTHSERLLLGKVVLLTDLLGMETPLRTIEIIRERPEILRLEPEEVVRRVMALKQAIPSGNIPGILFLRPSLVASQSDPGPTIERALRKMARIMPGIPVERQLHRGAGAWRSFVEILRDSEGASAFRARGGR